MTLRHELWDVPDYSSVKTLPQAILIALGTGVVLAAGLVAPNALQILKPFLKQGRRSNYERERIRQAIKALRHRRLIDYKEQGGETYIEVTEYGRKFVKKYQIERMDLPRTAWDKTWRVVLFDIPEQQKKERHAFQAHLKRLGCFLMQKSVWIYPYACRDEIDFLASFWDVHRFVRYLETTDLGISEAAARKFFKLL